MQANMQAPGVGRLASQEEGDEASSSHLPAWIDQCARLLASQRNCSLHIAHDQPMLRAANPSWHAQLRQQQRSVRQRLREALEFELPKLRWRAYTLMLASSDVAALALSTAGHWKRGADTRSWKRGNL